MKNLQLSLKKQWFELTKSGIKTEDYREINDYWTKRLTITNIDWSLSKEQCEQVIENFKNNTCKPLFKSFNYNIMTLGYPKSTDVNRIIKFEHKGVEIGYGKEEWGAEINKLYFVIKHGKQIINKNFNN